MVNANHALSNSWEMDCAEMITSLQNLLIAQSRSGATTVQHCRFREPTINFLINSILCISDFLKTDNFRCIAINSKYNNQFQDACPMTFGPKISINTYLTYKWIIMGSFEEVLPQSKYILLGQISSLNNNYSYNLEAGILQ